MAEYHMVDFLHRKIKPMGFGNPEPLCTRSCPTSLVFTKGDVVQFHDEDAIKQYHVNDVKHLLWSQGGFGGYKLSIILVDAE